MIDMDVTTVKKNLHDKIKELNIGDSIAEDINSRIENVTVLSYMAGYRAAKGSDTTSDVLTNILKNNGREK